MPIRAADVVASVSPWLVNVITDRPTIMLPANIRTKNMYTSFIVEEDKKFFEQFSNQVITDHDVILYSTKLCKEK